MRTKKEKVEKKFEEALCESFNEDVLMDSTFKKNLDKLVSNTIDAVEIEEQRTQLEEKLQKKSFFQMVFRSSSWQMSFLASFMGILLIGGTVFAAVPSLREIIIPVQGNLIVNTDPDGADVLINGGEYESFTKIGTTPLNKTLKAGNYVLNIENDGYELYEGEFQLEAGKSKHFDIVLEKIFSVLNRIKEWKNYINRE